VERVGTSATLDKREHGLLFGFGLGVGAPALVTTNGGFVGFNDLAFAADGINAHVLHGLTDAMAHEPRGLIGHV
jgi:hypothetical protein